MIDIEDVEEFYEKVIEDYTKHVIENGKKIVDDDPKVVCIFTYQLKKNSLVPLEVAYEMIECGYDPMNGTDVDEFYEDIVEQYILNIIKEKKKLAKKAPTNIIKFPSPKKKLTLECSTKPDGQ